MKKFTKMLVLAAAMVMMAGSGNVAEAKGTVKSVKITSPKVNKKTKTYVINRKGENVKKQLKFTVSVKNGASKKVKVTSKNSKIVAVETKSNKYYLVAKKAGTTTITVASTQNKKKKATIKVQVKQLVTGIQPTVKKAVASWNDGKNVTLKVGGKGYAISNKFTGATPSSKAVTYKSSKKSVLTVSSKGKLTAKKAGTAKITITAKDGSKKKATITVKVLPKKYTKVTSVKADVEQLDMNVANKTTAKINVTVSSSKATYKTVAYTSSNKKVATVDSKGNVKAVAPGEATITIKAVDGSKKSDTVKVIVKNDITSIKANAETASVYVGETVAVKAVVNSDAYDTTVTYSIDAASQNVATVDAKTGVVTGKARGTVNVVAKSANGKTATIKVTVSDKTVSTVTPVKDGKAEVHATFSGKAADVEAKIIDALKTVGAGDAEKKIIVNGVTKTLAYKSGALTVDGKAFKDVVTNDATVTVVFTQKTIDFVKGLQLVQLKPATYDYTVKIGNYTFTKLTVDTSYITLVGEKTYKAYVENGTLYVVGTVDADLKAALEKEGFVVK